MLARRDALRWTAAPGGGAGSTARHATAATTAVRLICGFGVGNPTDLCAQLIQDGFSTALNEPVEFDYTLGQAGRRAALEVIGAEPDGRAATRNLVCCRKRDVICCRLR